MIPFAIGLIVGLLSGYAAPHVIADARSLPMYWHEPDENLRPWFRWVRRVLGGKARGEL